MAYAAGYGENAQGGAGLPRGRSPHDPPFILLGEEVITCDHAHTRGRVHVHTFVYLIYQSEEEHVTLLIFVVENSPLVFFYFLRSSPLSRSTQCLAAGTIQHPLWYTCTHIRAPPPLTSALRRAIPTITAPRHRRRRGPLLHLLLVLLLFVWCPAALSTIPLSPLSLLLLPRVMLQLSWAVAIPPSAQCHIRRILIRLTPSLRPLPLSMAVPATVKMLHLLCEARRILK